MTGGSYWPKTNASELHFARSFHGHPTWPYFARPNMRQKWIFGHIRHIWARQIWSSVKIKVCSNNLSELIKTNPFTTSNAKFQIQGALMPYYSKKKCLPTNLKPHSTSKHRCLWTVDIRFLTALLSIPGKSNSMHFSPCIAFEASSHWTISIDQKPWWSYATAPYTKKAWSHIVPILPPPPHHGLGKQWGKENPEQSASITPPLSCKNIRGCTTYNSATML